MSAKKAIVLLSGGVDSSTTLAIAKNEGFDCYALSFEYGQRHSLELEAAKRIAMAIKVSEHYIISIDLTLFGHSALTDYRLAVPKNRPEPRKAQSHTHYLCSCPQHDIFKLRPRVVGSARMFRYFHRRKCDGLQRLSRLPRRVYHRVRKDGQSRHRRRRQRQGQLQHSHAPDRNDQGQIIPAAASSASISQ